MNFHFVQRAIELNRRQVSRLTGEHWESPRLDDIYTYFSRTEPREYIIFEGGPGFGLVAYEVMEGRRMRKIKVPERYVNAIAIKDGALVYSPTEGFVKAKPKVRSRVLRLVDSAMTEASASAGGGKS